jgi:CHAT domain-containing protein
MDTLRQRRLHRAQAELPAALTTLSQLVLGPVSAQIGGKRLAIVADGALHYIPFAMLPEPAPLGSATRHAMVPLVVGHEVVNLPSASVLAVLRQQQAWRRKASKAVVVFADPVFERTDPRINHAGPSVPRSKSSPSEDDSHSVSSDLLTRSAGDLGMSRDGKLSLPRLLFSRQEADAIGAVTPSGQLKEAVDFQANRAAATGPDLRDYRIVHFATHGLLNSEHPELSGLVLSLVDEHGQPQDGFLQLQDIYNLDLPADLVVLSACETGLGKEINGEGLIGLTRGFMYAGASRVVASLWKVSDAATASLMAEFYRAMEKDHMSPAAALRTAQIHMWQQKRWTSPYYWAAFQIQGEWK